MSTKTKTKTKTISLRAISRRKLRAWLAEHPRMQFGCGDSERCPVGRYTGRCTPGARTLQEYSYAPWLVAFVSKVDAGDESRITGKQALALLDQVPA